MHKTFIGIVRNKLSKPLKLRGGGGNLAKIFRITGQILRKGEPMFFRKEYRALKPEHALEILYSEFGGRYKVKRSKIKILNIEEISPEEVTDPIIKKLITA